MRSILIFLSLLLVVSSSALYDEEDSFDQEVLRTMPDDDPKKVALANVVKKNLLFRDRLWAANPMCRAQVLPRGNESDYHCKRPLSGESCFGVPIDYSYLADRGQLPSLPSHYEALRRFPKCWDKLGPMLCGIIYRPCRVYGIATKHSKDKDSLQFWQRFPIGMCQRVHTECSDAIKEGLFPSDLIDCTRTVSTQATAWHKEQKNLNGTLARSLSTEDDLGELKTEWERQTVFTEETCSLLYTENASRHERMQCIFPLVFSNQTAHIAPVIDNCYMPCRNPLISTPDKFLSFRIIRALLCFAVAPICLAIFFFLAVRSLIFVQSDVVFSIACCLLYLAVYLVCWGIGSISYFAEASECTHTVDGVAIRNTLLERPWCWLTAFVAHVSLLASIGFLSAAYALSTAAATKAAAREEEKENKSGDDSFSSPGIRFYLVAGVSIVSIAIGLIAAGLNMVSTDGVAGVCSVGLHSFLDHLAVVAGPGLLYCLIGLAWGARGIWREKKDLEAEISQEIEERIHEAIEHEKSKEKVDYLNERGPNWKEEVLEHIRRGSQPPSIEDKTETRGSTEEGAVVEKKESEEEQREGEDEITTLTTVLIPGGDEDEEKQWLSDDRKEEIRATVREERQKEWRERQMRAWHEGISSRYTLLALCICVFSMLLGLAVHSANLANHGQQEYEAVRSYVTCVMLKSIVRKDSAWLAAPHHAAEMWADGDAENDPLVRRRNLAGEITIHDCEFPSTGDDRMFGLMLVFVVFPLLPILVFIWAFFEGLAGAGGMKKVRARRLKKKRVDDVEMATLATRHDGHSQMMSSECSSMGDRNYDRHSAASSTVSTRLSSAASAASEASSSHTSVSLRGALPRFPSTERLMTVHATAPVPSVAQSVPERRSRSAAPHHRTLDVMGRMRERRARMGKIKKRASSAERNARREGVAESGQFVPRDDTRSVHSQATERSMLMEEALSHLAPPSEYDRALISLSVAYLRNVAREAAERGAGMQQQLQLLQEELVLCALQRDDWRVRALFDHSHHRDWVGRLTAVREILGRHQDEDLYAHVAYRGFFLSGQTIALARIIFGNGTFDCLSNIQTLLFALERVDRLAYCIESRHGPSPELAADIEEGVAAVSRQIELNGLQDARALQQSYPIVLDVNNQERVGQRARLIAQMTPPLPGSGEAARSWEETVAGFEAILAEMLAGSNRRYEHEMARRQWDQLQLRQQLQQSVGRAAAPVYAPQRIVDLRLPPDGVEARSEAGSSFSMTNSTVPSSAMTTHDQNRVVRLDQETTQRRPPDGEEPSSSTSSSNRAASAAAAAADRSDLPAFIADVMRANPGVAARLRQTDHFDLPTSSRPSPPPHSYQDDAAHLPAFIADVMRANPGMAARLRQTDYFDLPTSNHPNDLRNAYDDDDVMSSETSMDSMGRRTAPSMRRYENAGGFVVPVVQQQVPAASAAGQLQTSVPRLVPFPVPAGAALPPSLFPQFASASASGAAEQTPDVSNGRSDNQKKRKTVGEGTAPSCQASRRRRNDDDDSTPPPAVNRVFVQELQPGSSSGLMAMPLDGLTAATREGRGGRGAAVDEEEEEGSSVVDSGIDSLASINQGFVLLKIEGDTRRPATNEEFVELVRRAAEQRDIRPRGNAGRPEGEEEVAGNERSREEEEAGPSNDEERRRRRMQLRNVHLNHSDPDLAVAEEAERERRLREMNEDAEQWEREQMAIAEARRVQRERDGAAPVVDRHADFRGSEESISSLLTAEQQVELVRQLRDALERRSTDGMEPEHRRLVEHLRLALDTQGGISREEIMRYRVMETNREAREAQAPDRNSPYSVSSVVISRFSLAEIDARADAIRALSDTTLYPLEVYYQLHLADVLWPLAGRDVMLGDNVYTHDEINRALGADSPVVPAGWNSDDFHQLMRKRAITAASLTGRSYGRSRGTEGPEYMPPRLPDMGLYRTFQDPSVVLAAIGGDLEPIRRAIEHLQLTMPDVMRLDNRSEHTLGSHLRHFRDYLDERARAAGFALRADTYAADAVPQEPTGSRTQQLADSDEEAPDPAADPDF